MNVSSRGDPVVTLPAVSMDRASRRDRLKQESFQTPGAGVRDLPHADPPDSRAIFFGRNNYQGFVFNQSPAQSFFDAAQIAFARFAGTLPSRNPSGRGYLSQAHALLVNVGIGTIYRFYPIEAYISWSDD